MTSKTNTGIDTAVEPHGLDSCKSLCLDPKDVFRLKL